jgi:hypothetical protein
MPGRISLCNSKPVYEGHIQGTPLYVRLVLQRGWTHKRADPFPSTTLPFYLWQRAEPKDPSTAPSSTSFPDHEEAVFPKAGRQSRFRQQQPLFWVDFFSGQNGVMQQGRHTSAFPAARPGRKGTHKGRPYSTVRFATGQNMHRTADPFPSTTICIYVWRRAELKAAGTAPSGCVFPQLRGGRLRVSGCVPVSNRLRLRPAS